MTTDMGIALTILGILAGLLLLLGLTYLLVLVRPRRKPPMDPALLCDYAHRGLHGGGIPENSSAAFEKACREGYGIELDIRLSRDGCVMVFHDDTLTRMTGCDKAFGALDRAELEALSLAGTEERIPTFARVLELVDGRVPLLVELKGEDLDTSLCTRAAELLRDYTGPFCVESFNPLLLRGMRKALPGVCCGLLYTNVCRDKGKTSLLNLALTAMALNCLAGPRFIAYNQKDRRSLPVRIAAGLCRAPRFVWTVRGEGEYAEAKGLGECAIFERGG